MSLKLLGASLAGLRAWPAVRRPAGPHSPLVHALLAHLESVGFEGAPRFLGIDESGREVPRRSRWPVLGVVRGRSFRAGIRRRRHAAFPDLNASAQAGKPSRQLG
jgi:hypothetical protein